MSTGQKRTVTMEEGLRYGLELIGYILALAITGGGIALVGLFGFGINIGGVVVASIGFFVFYAGFLGLGYKVIADGVSAGVGNTDE